MSDFTRTPNLALYKPTPNADGDVWGDHLNANADVLDALLGSGGTASGPFLPLSGGTVTGTTAFNARLTNAVHMTTNAYDSNATINATAVGSGTAGPATGQMGLTINLAKDNWYTGASVVGEIDGLSIICRQGGTGSDCGAILSNVVGTGNGFLAISESVVQQQQVNTGTPLYGIRQQVGGMDPVAGSRIGEMLRADYGNLTTAILTINTAGQGSWGYVLQNTKDNVQNFTIDDSGNVYAPAASAFFATIHAPSHVYLRADTVIDIFYNGGSNAIGLYNGGAGVDILGSGGIAIWGTKVIGTQIAGWGTSTGGVRGAITGSSTLPQVAAALSQLLTDLKTHGMIGA